MTDGKKRKIVRDLTGQTFGFLTMLKPSDRTAGHGKRAIWWARCVCGKELEVGTDGYRNNRKPFPSNCGCKTHELRSAGRRVHGMSDHPSHWVWSSMIARCTVPTNKAWKDYGGRGITVCEQWERSFRTFWADMGPTYQSGLQIERIDNNRGYEPGNCKWATRREQMRNTRKNRMIDTPKGRMLVVEASEISGIGVTTLLYRLANDWATHELFLPPDAGNRWR